MIMRRKPQLDICFLCGNKMEELRSSAKIAWYCQDCDYAQSPLPRDYSNPMLRQEFTVSGMVIPFVDFTREYAPTP